MATTKKRVVSLLMALVMALSLLPTIAFASDTQIQEEKQIMEGYYQADDTNQAVTETVVNQEQNSSAGGNVKVSKTIAATGTENVFEITLEVQTKQKLSETATSPDAAIVLVMDRSGSMKYCAECGKNSIERETESKYYCNGTSGKEFEGKNWKRCENCGKWLSEHNAVEVVTESCNRQGCDSTQSRLTAAKAGAIDFMNQLLEDTAKNADGSYTAHRYISVASFAARSSTSLDCDWVDITTTDGYNAAVAAVNGLEANGGTYLQGGLQRAVNQMGKTNAINGTVDITKVANRYTVVLTDGKPTYSKDYGNGSSCSENICNQTAGTAAELKKLSSVYSICYGADSETCYGDVTVGDFLGRISSAYYSADNISELNTAFGNISDLIALLTEAWKVTDPMGEHISFGKVISNGKHTQGEDLANCTNGTLVWDLKGDVPYDTTGSNSNKTYTYKLKYTITLDTTSGIQNNTPYPTNGYTYLTYVFYNEDGQLVDEDGNLVENQDEPNVIGFNVPGVKGYLGELSFDKQDPSGNAVSGAQFTLTCQDCEPAHSVTATSGTNGRVAFQIAQGKGIPSGHTYTLTETRHDGYQELEDTYDVAIRYGEPTVTKNGTEVVNADKMTVVNKHDPKPAQLTITKQWLPTSDIPTSGSVTVALFSGETQVGENIELSAANSWQASVQIPTVDENNGGSLTGTYTVKEVSTTVSGSKPQADAFNVVYTDGKFTCTVVNVLPGEMDITVEKVWVDGKSSHPDVTLGLFAGASTTPVKTAVLSDSKLSETFAAMPRYDMNGDEISYYVAEQVNGQWVTSGPYDFAGTSYTVSTDGCKVINTITQDNTLTIGGHKTWVDGNDTAKRPSEVIMELYADGAATGLTAAATGDSWVYAFEGSFPRYALPDTTVGSVTYSGANANGHEIVYTVQDSVDGYTMTDEGDAENGYTVTNTRSDINAVADVTVTKVWEDDNNANGTRPDSVTLILQRSANGVTDSDFTMSQTFTQGQQEIAESDPETGEPTAYEIMYEDTQSYTFEDLAVYNSEGYKYTYTVTEQGESENKLAGKSGVQYAVSYDQAALKVTNALDESSASTTVTVHKAWIAPTTEDLTVTVHVMNGETSVASQTLNGTEETPWTYTFENLPVFDGQGKKITYTVKEDAVEGYTAGEPVQNADGSWTITNTIAQDSTMEVSVEKTWNNGTATIPGSLEVTLYADSQKVGSCNLTAEGWNHTFTGLPRYAIPGTNSINGTPVSLEADGHAIRYTVEEAQVTGYTMVSSSRTESLNVSYHFTNAFDAGITNFQVTKSWKDGGSTSRPASVWVGLFADGVYKDHLELTADSWSGTFSNLPLYSDVNEQITYAVREMSGESDTEGKTSGSIQLDGNTYGITILDGVITNTLEGDHEGTEVVYTVNKVWNGPSSTDIAFGLFAGTSDTPIQTITGGQMQALLTTENVWTGSFEPVAKFDGNGDRISYVVKELYTDTENQQVAVTEGEAVFNGISYTVSSEISGNTTIFTNTVVETNDASFSGQKHWNLENAPSGVNEPASIQVELYADDVATGKTATVSSEDDWKYAWTGLQKYNSETHMPIVYSVREVGAYSMTTLDEEGSVQQTVVKYGNNYYTVVYEGNGDITNTYRTRDEYKYRVDRVYNYYYNGTLQTTTSVTGVLENGDKDQLITDLNTDSYKSTDGRGEYTYISGTPTIELDDGTKVGVTLEEPGEYVITLTYEYRATGGGGGDDPTPTPPPTDPGTNIEDPDVPLGDLPQDPTQPAEPDEPVEIDDPDVPLSDAPVTGDSSMALWLTLMATSALGIAVLTLSDRKKGKRESQ